MDKSLTAESFIMDFPEYVVTNAHDLITKSISGEITLPALIPDSPSYYVASEMDETVMAFGGITKEGVEYKIGTLKKKN